MEMRRAAANASGETLEQWWVESALSGKMRVGSGGPKGDWGGVAKSISKGES